MFNMMQQNYFKDCSNVFAVLFIHTQGVFQMQFPHLLSRLATVLERGNGTVGECNAETFQVIMSKLHLKYYS
jgi:hypothetical protein